MRELAKVELIDILLINYKKRCAWKVHDLRGEKKRWSEGRGRKRPC